MKSKEARAWGLRLVGFLLFAIVLSRIDFSHSWAIIRRADPVALFLATLLIFPMMALKTLRWRWLQQSSGIPEVSFTRSFLAYFSGMYAGLITPGRVGELIRVRYLTDRGAPVGPAFSTVLWDRIIDVLGLFLMGVLALWPLAREFRGLYLAVTGITIGIGLVVVVLVTSGARGALLLDRLSKRFLLGRGRLGDGLAKVVPGLLEGVSRLGAGPLLGLFTLTLLGWVVYYLQAWLIAGTLGIHIPLFPLVVSVTAAAVAAFLPLSISGLGTRDAAMVVLFRRFGHPGEEALALSAVIFLVLVVNALIGLVATQLLEVRPAAAGSIRD